MTVRVLLVEDDAVVRETTALVLGRMQIESAGAADGRAALDLLAGGDPFDLVVLDLMLPGMDGLDVCREIRRTSRIPIVMLSARDDITDVVSGLELGADDYVTKPFDGRELAARIRRAAPPQQPAAHRWPRRRGPSRSRARSRDRPRGPPG